MPDYYEARLVERELEVMQYAFIEKTLIALQSVIFLIKQNLM